MFLAKERADSKGYLKLLAMPSRVSSSLQSLLVGQSLNTTKLNVALADF